MEKVDLPIVPELQPYVAKALVCKQEKGEQSIMQFVPRLLPGFFFMLKDGDTIDIHVNGKFSQLKSSSISFLGAGCSPANMESNLEVCVIVVLLFPYSVPLFFRDDAFHFSEDRFDLTDTSPDIRILNEKLTETDNVYLQWQLIQQFMIQGFTAKETHTYRSAIKAVQCISNHKGLIDINEVAGQTYTCTRNLTDIFKQHIGMSPKKFSDALRFNTFINASLQNQISLSKRAMSHGYYDLSHLNKDFLRFMNCSPSDFFAMLRVPQPIWNGNGNEIEYH